MAGKPKQIRKMTDGDVIRQGDVYLIRVSGVPTNAKPKQDRILAYGETTGHKHQLMGGNVLVQSSGRQWAVLEQPTVLEHEEHKNLFVPAGMYEVRIQREYDLVDGVRQVMD